MLLAQCAISTICVRITKSTDCFQQQTSRINPPRVYPWQRGKHLSQSLYDLATPPPFPTRTPTNRTTIYLHSEAREIKFLPCFRQNCPKVVVHPGTFWVCPVRGPRRIFQIISWLLLYDVMRSWNGSVGVVARFRAQDNHGSVPGQYKSPNRLNRPSGTPSLLVNPYRG